MAPTCVDDATLIGQGERTVRQADGKYLVRPDAGPEHLELPNKRDMKNFWWGL